MGVLTVKKIEALKDPGRYTDGDGLMLVVGKDGSKKWVLRIMVDGVRRDIGLGSVRTRSLAEARRAAAETRDAAKAGRDVVAEKRAAKEAQPEPRRKPTFRDVAEALHKEQLPTWKNQKHAAQWLSTLREYAFPQLGDLPIDAVTGPMIRDVLSPIWLEIPETARRVRQRIGAVLDHAHAIGLRENEAPMRALVAGKGLPRQPARTDHFAAMPYGDVPAFLAALDTTQKAGPVVKALLRYVILTACRSGEARGATWGEIDLEAATWTVPAERMKAGRQHVVPLSAPALIVLGIAKAWRTDTGPAAYIFPGERSGRPVSDMALTMCLRRMETGATAHGFRSSFRDWAAECTDFPREVAELSLAHTVGNAVERAYRRSDLLEKRRALMMAWADFLTGLTATDDAINGEAA